MAKGARYDAAPAAPATWHDAALAAGQAELAALTSLPEGRDVCRVAEVLGRLNERIRAAQEFEQFDPYAVRSVQIKEHYRPVETIKLGREGAAVFQLLPHGQIAFGLVDGRVGILTPRRSGGYRREFAGSQHGSAECLQVLPDGRMICGSADMFDGGGELVVWSRLSTGRWNSEVLFRDEQVPSLHALPDGRIAACTGLCLSVFLRDHSGTWRREPIAAAGQRIMVSSVQGLPDGRIVTSSSAGSAVWSRTSAGVWTPAELSPLGGQVQVLPDGRLVIGTDRFIALLAPNPRGHYRERFRLTGTPWDFRVLADERIVVVREAELSIGTLRRATGVWRVEPILTNDNKPVVSFEITADGRIFTASKDGITIWDGDPVEGA